MRILRRCRHVTPWPLLHGSPQLTEQKMENSWDGEGESDEEERRTEIGMTAILVDDIKLLKRVEPDLYPYQVKCSSFFLFLLTFYKNRLTIYFASGCS